MIIRNYEEADWERLTEIHDAARKVELKLAGLSPAFLPLVEAAENEGLFEYNVRVACVDDEVAGFTAYSAEELAWLYVAPSHMHRGIGKKLVEYVIEHTTERPLNVEVLAGNEPAVRLYESCGFRLIETASGRMAGNEAFEVKVHIMQLKHKHMLCKNVRENDEKRAAYDALAKKVFGLSFERWYQSGYWSDTHLPYTFFDGNRAVANISVNRMKIKDRGEIRHFIQLGTVMTDPEYEKQGLSRFLMEEVIKDWAERCDGMFLFANETVLDFYPRFGFRRQTQYQYRMCVSTGAFAPVLVPGTLPVTEDSAGTDKTIYADKFLNHCNFRKLAMDNAEGVEILKRCYEKTNPFSALQAVDNFGLLMFYCGSFRKDDVYYSEILDAVIIASAEDGVLYCSDIYCDEKVTLQQMMEAFLSILPEKIETAVFGFTPVDADGCTVNVVEDEDDVLFVLEGKENLFSEVQLLFPELSHT